MNFFEQLEKIFVTEEEIAAEFKLPSEVNQRTILLNGEMIQWDGRTGVYSPVCLSYRKRIEKKAINTYPVCTQKDAKEALDAAVTAYNDGRGKGSTMSVSDRITLR